MTSSGSRSGEATTTPRLTKGTLLAAALGVLLAQVALAIPAVLNGLFQEDLLPSSSQLTWISDAFLVPVTLLELSFGVLGDLFGRKRLLVGGAILLAIGEGIAVLTPGSSSSTDLRVAVLWTGQIIAGIGAAALFPTTLAMVAAGTHTPRERARSITIWAAALSTGGFVSPVLGGLLADKSFGSDEHAGWRWAFLAVLLLALISAVVSMVAARTSSAPEGRSLDLPGQLTIAISLFALLFAVIQGPTSGWGSASVVGGFIVAAVFLVAFVVVENRHRAPLLRLDVFRNRAFAVAAVATVFGMFSFLGTAYSTSIRLSSIQGFSPLKTSIAFVLLQGMALLLISVTSRAVEAVNPRWTLGIGFALIAVGDFWLAAISASNTSIAVIVAPLVIVGVGFAFSVSSVTAVAVDTVPNHLTGMASGTTSMLRDFGFTLGPAVIGAVALSRAAAQIASKVHSSPALSSALEKFYGSAAHAPPAQRAQVEAAIGAVKSGPLGANGVPATVTTPDGKTMPFNPVKDVAFHALDSAYSLGYIICGIAAAIAAALAIFALRGSTRDAQIAQESLAD